MLRAWPVIVASAVAALLALSASAATAETGSPASAAAKRVYVMTNAGFRTPKIRPTSMHILSNENLGKMKWSSWGRSTASAHGIHYAGGPSPGHKAQNPVRIQLYGIKECGSRQLYTKMKITFTEGKPYASGPRTEKFPFGCP